LIRLLNGSRVRVCRDLTTPDLYAVKFIDKLAALDGHDPKSRKGQSILHQISLEVGLHRICSDHRNVIKLIATNETPIWRWIALEWAEGGDLFDKIGILHMTKVVAYFRSDPDVGVDEDIAQFYFLQLLDAMVSEDFSRLLTRRNSVTAKELPIEVLS